MLVRVLLVAAVLIVCFFLIRWLRRSPWAARVPHVLMAVGIVGFLLLLTVRGGGEIAVPLLAVLTPFLLRWLNTHSPSLSMPGGSPQQGQSVVTTQFLRMMLDHATGAMSGVVREGRFAGRSLQDLNLRELLDFWRECQTDPQSVAVLEAYLDRHGDPAWRDQFRDSEHAGPTADATAAPSSHMDRTEAYEILGLRVGSSRDEIQAAYRRLMQRVHPDQGGSSYLAARINQARDVLLDE